MSNRLFDKQLRAVLGREHAQLFVLTDGNGLGARVSPKGNVRWQFRFKIKGKSRRLDLGNYPEMSLAAARQEHQQCRLWLDQGYDPKLKRQLRMQEAAPPATVTDALEYWLEEYAHYHRKNKNKIRAQFSRHIYPYIGSLPLEQAGLKQWLQCFDQMRKGIKGKQKPVPSSIGSVFQNAKQALSFCRIRQFAMSNILDDLKASDVGAKLKSRERVLSNKELSELCRLLKDKNLNAYYSNLVQLLVVFGARTQEIRLSQWKEWDFDEMLWTVPEAHSKSGKKIIRPIPVGLVEFLLVLKKGAGQEGLILGDLKKAETVSQYGRKIYKRLNHEERWSLHDLRRTFTTRLNDLGVAPYVVEQMTGHVLGGVMGIYNRSQYLSEKRDGLELWLNHIQSMGNFSEKVVSFTAMNRMMVA
ncbi:tyrosine-type recombinase/integrase [Vibrio mediterranei]|uniref:tyrosine-type recombinase/integrase n=2 Tax=Vibrio TaxID=662 RepID=UPI0040680F47